MRFGPANLTLQDDPATGRIKIQGEILHGEEPEVIAILQELEREGSVAKLLAVYQRMYRRFYG